MNGSFVQANEKWQISCRWVLVIEKSELVNSRANILVVRCAWTR